MNKLESRKKKVRIYIFPGLKEARIFSAKTPSEALRSFIKHSNLLCEATRKIFEFQDRAENNRAEHKKLSIQLCIFLRIKIYVLDSGIHLMYSFRSRTTYQTVLENPLKLKLITIENLYLKFSLFSLQSGFPRSRAASSFYFPLTNDVAYRVQKGSKWEYLWHEKKVVF